MSYHSVCAAIWTKYKANAIYNCCITVSSSQSKPSLVNSSSNVGGKAMNSIKKAVAIKSDSEEAKPLVDSSNGR